MGPTNFSSKSDSRKQGPFTDRDQSSLKIWSTKLRGKLASFVYEFDDVQCILVVDLHRIMREVHNETSKLVPTDEVAVESRLEFQQKKEPKPHTFKKADEIYGAETLWKSGIQPVKFEVQMSASEPKIPLKISLEADVTANLQFRRLIKIPNAEYVVEEMEKTLSGIRKVEEWLNTKATVQEFVGDDFEFDAENSSDRASGQHKHRNVETDSVKMTISVTSEDSGSVKKMPIDEEAKQRYREYWVQNQEFLPPMYPQPKAGEFALKRLDESGSTEGIIPIVSNIETAAFNIPKPKTEMATPIYPESKIELNLFTIEEDKVIETVPPQTVGTRRHSPRGHQSKLDRPTERSSVSEEVVIQAAECLPAAVDHTTAITPKEQSSTEELISERRRHSDSGFRESIASFSRASEELHIQQRQQQVLANKCGRVSETPTELSQSLSESIQIDSHFDSGVPSSPPWKRIIEEKMDDEFKSDTEVRRAPTDAKVSSAINFQKIGREEKTSAEKELLIPRVVDHTLNTLSSKEESANKHFDLQRPKDVFNIAEVVKQIPATQSVEGHSKAAGQEVVSFQTSLSSTGDGQKTHFLVRCKSEERIRRSLPEFLHAETTLYYMKSFTDTDEVVETKMGDKAGQRGLMNTKASRNMVADFSTQIEKTMREDGSSSIKFTTSLVDRAELKSKSTSDVTALLERTFNTGLKELSESAERIFRCRSKAKTDMKLMLEEMKIPERVETARVPEIMERVRSPSCTLQLQTAQIEPAIDKSEIASDAQKQTSSVLENLTIRDTPKQQLQIAEQLTQLGSIQQPRIEETHEETLQINLMQTVDDSQPTRVSVPQRSLEERILKTQAAVDVITGIDDELKSPKQVTSEAQMILKTTPKEQGLRNFIDQVQNTDHTFAREDSASFREHTQKDVTVEAGSNQFPEFGDEKVDVAAMFQRLTKPPGHSECDVRLKDDRGLSNVLSTEASREEDSNQQSVCFHRPDSNQMIDMTTSVYIMDEAQLDSKASGEEVQWLESSLNWSADSQETVRLLKTPNTEELQGRMRESSVENTNLIQDVKYLDVADLSTHTSFKDGLVEKTDARMNEFGRAEATTIAALERVPRPTDRQESELELKAKQNLFGFLTLDASRNEDLTKEMVLQRLIQPSAVAKVAENIARADFAHFSAKAASEIAEFFQKSIVSTQQSEEIGHLVKTGNIERAKARVRELIEEASNLSTHYDLVDQESLAHILLADVSRDSHLLSTKAVAEFAIDIRAELQNALEKEGASVKHLLKAHETGGNLQLRDALTNLDASFQHVSDHELDAIGTRSDLNVATAEPTRLREYEKDETTLTAEWHRVSKPRVIEESLTNISVESRTEGSLKTLAPMNIISESAVILEGRSHKESKNVLVTERIESKESFQTEESRYDALGIGREFIGDSQKLESVTILPASLHVSTEQRFKQFGEEVSALQAQLDVVDADAHSEAQIRTVEKLSSLLNAKSAEKAEATVQQDQRRPESVEGIESVRAPVSIDFAQKSFKISQETISPSIKTERLTEVAFQIVDDSRKSVAEPKTVREFGVAEVESTAQLVRAKREQGADTAQQFIKESISLSEAYSGKVPKPIEQHAVSAYELQEAGDLKIEPEPPVKLDEVKIPDDVAQEARQITRPAIQKDERRSFEAIYSTFDADIEYDAVFKEPLSDRTSFTTKQPTDLHTATFNTILPIPVYEATEVVKPFTQTSEDQRKFIIEVANLRQQFAQGSKTEDIQKQVSKINEIQGPRVSLVEAGEERDIVEVLLVRQPLQKRSLKTEHLIGVNTQLAQVLSSRYATDIHTESSCEWHGPEAKSEATLSVKSARSVGPELLDVKSVSSEQQAFSSTLVKTTETAADKKTFLQGPLLKAISEKLREFGEGMFSM